MNEVKKYDKDVSIRNIFNGGMIYERGQEIR